MTEKRYTLHLYRHRKRVRFNSPKFKNQKAAIKWLESVGIEPFCGNWWTLRRPHPYWETLYELLSGCRFKLLPIKKN